MHFERKLEKVNAAMVLLESKVILMSLIKTRYFFYDTNKVTVD